MDKEGRGVEAIAVVEREALVEGVWRCGGRPR